MTAGAANLHRVANHPVTILIGNLASVVSFLWFFYDKLVERNPGLLSTIVFAGCLFFFLGVALYSVRIRRREQAWQDTANRLHRINHDYRDALATVFHKSHPKPKKEEVLRVQEQTLRAACQQIKEIFSGISGHTCTVTVKLITKNGTKQACSTYVRSEDNCPRDRQEPMEYELGTWKNTAFDKALQLNKPSGCSHFYSPDLEKETDYYNQRQHWEQFYRSALVVPIRSVQCSIEGNSVADDAGFLCVDTMSTNRLNNSYHLQLLAAFADQMYNFLSLMRGEYKMNELE